MVLIWLARTQFYYNTVSCYRSFKSSRDESRFLKKTHLIAELQKAGLDIWGHSKGGKTASYSQINALHTVKILKVGTPQTIAITVLKLVKFDVTLHPKEADAMANSVDPDQTASSEAV